MPTDEEFEELKGRLTELENTVRELGGRRAAPQVTEAEYETFLKVQGALGAAAALPIRAITVCTWPCIGPCALPCGAWPCGFLFPEEMLRRGGGAGRFGGLGG